MNVIQMFCVHCVVLGIEKEGAALTKCRINAGPAS